METEINNTETQAENQAEIQTEKQVENPAEHPPTVNPLGLFEMLRYENTRHASPAAVQNANKRDATSGILSRTRKSVWDLTLPL